MTDREEGGNDFRRWLVACGHNAKQVSAAGALIGLTDRAALARYRGELPLNLTERLAMTAARLGLPPWSPDTAGEVEGAGEALDLAHRLAAFLAKRNGGPV